MNCPNCISKRVVSVLAKCDDRCVVSTDDKEIADYVQDDMGIGHGDYIKFEYCLECGKIIGDFPLPETRLEAKE